MKEALKKGKTYLITGILVSIAFTAMLIWYLIAFFSDEVGLSGIEFVVWIFGILYFLIGWISGNNVSFSWRKNNAKYDDPLPDDIKKEAWKRRVEFWFPALILILIGICFDITAIVTGYYPISGAPYTPRIRVK